MSDDAKIKKSETALREEGILGFWENNKIVEKVLTKSAPKGEFVFYQGPPFATGIPHYGQILGNATKDTILRFRTMRGYHVDRKWGWDCHGLPIENIAEKGLGISGRKKIEEYGIAKFCEYAKSKVLGFVDIWRADVYRTGLWMNFDDAYKTMDNSYIESVWWALSELYKKNLIYEDKRVLLYCPRCETPIANSEIAMDNSYKDITDISVYAKFKLKDKIDPSLSSGRVNMNTYLLAWTTTPWTLPGNVALAVNKDAQYVEIEIENSVYILAKDRIEAVIKVPYKIVGEIKGIDLIGRKYEPLFDYYIHDEKIGGNKKAWTIVEAPFVTMDAGAGVVHISPAFGENDFALSKKLSLPIIQHVTSDGKFKPEVTHFAGEFVKPKDNHQGGDIMVVKYLAHNHLLFEKEKITHSYPHCYRCATPLLYYALPSWFINIQKQKNEFIKQNENINWVPSYLKDGRFKHILENAPDWTISRNRFWASPLPFWKNENTGEVKVIGSIEELKKYTKKSGNNYFIMRHGEIDKNITNQVSCEPAFPDHLNEKGKKQVYDSAQTLKDKKMDLIFASDFVRAEETASIVREVLSMHEDQIITEIRLRDMHIPSFSGRTWYDYHEKYPKTVENFEAKIKGDESYKDVKDRVSQFIYEIENRYSNKNIVIVTHGAPSWLLFAGALGYDKEESLNMIRHIKNFRYLTNAEIRKLVFVPLPHNTNYEFDLHRPYIDEVELVDENGDKLIRVPEVLDCWFESSSMPFASQHYPFANQDYFKTHFPADFVVEYIAQTRTWFNYMLTVGTLLFDSTPFKTVVSTGNLQGNDGRKMSKSFGNFHDPWDVYNTIGVDTTRFYLVSSPLLKGEDMAFSDKDLKNISQKIFGRLRNTASFYEMYADKNAPQKNPSDSNNVLDQWILTRLSQVLAGATSGLESFKLDESYKTIGDFVDDLSAWYLRRSRDRFKEQNEDSYFAQATLSFVLKTFAQILAPITPFIAEEIYQQMKTDGDPESVHLCDWPLVGKRSDLKDAPRSDLEKTNILENMRTTRKIVSLSLEARQKANIKVRQPLATLKLKVEGEKLPNEYLDLIKDEVNVKEVIFNDSIEGEVWLDADITEELQEEGNIREIVRAIQDMRKTDGLTPNDIITLSIETNEIGKIFIEKFSDDIKKSVQASQLSFGQNDGEQVDISNLIFKIKIGK